MRKAKAKPTPKPRAPGGGRKPIAPELRRVGIAARVEPSTREWLDGLAIASGSIGKALDELKRLCLQK